MREGSDVEGLDGLRERGNIEFGGYGVGSWTEGAYFVVWNTISAIGLMVASYGWRQLIE